MKNHQFRFTTKKKVASEEDDPVLQMLGVGKEIWDDQGGDAFVASERAGWSDDAVCPAEISPKASPSTREP